MNTVPGPRSRLTWGLCILLVWMAGLESGCDRGLRERLGLRPPGIKAARKPMPPPEIIVKLREEGKRLQTVIAHGDTTLLYGGAPLTIFDHLPEVGRLHIRQSFPEFSLKWQQENPWRSGSNDTVAIATLTNWVATCPLPDSVEGPVHNLIDKWQSTQGAVKESPDGLPAIRNLLRRTSVNVASDTAQAAKFLRSMQGRGVFGDRDPRAVPAILELVKCADIPQKDSLTIVQFARRIKQQGGDAGVADVALGALDRLAKQEPIGIRDSLAIDSWMRLLAGDNAFGDQPNLPAIDLYLRVHIDDAKVNVARLLGRLNDIHEVESAVRAFPVGPPTSAAPVNITQVQVLGTAQSYQDTAGVGIDVQAAWDLTGGNGKNVRLIVCDASYWEGHSDLPATNYNAAAPVSGQITMFRKPWGASANSQIHGTETLGILLAKHDGTDCDGWGCGCPASDGSYADSMEVNGMCTGVQSVYFSSTLPDSEECLQKVDGVTSALDGITHWLSSEITAGGDVLILEAQLASNLGGSSPSMLPVEANTDNFTFIQTLVTQYKVTVVEPAGNGRGLLSAIDDGQKMRWDPTRDSGAIMVGAGNPGCASSASLWTPLAKMAETNYGDRVDCQAWGMLVQTTTFDPFSGHEAYTTFTHTSGASAIVAGLVACFQSTYYEVYGMYLPPTGLRAALRDNDLGTPQYAPEQAKQRIGPMPSLRKLLIEFGILPPAV